MFLPCPDCPIRKKRLFRPFSSEELAFVTAAKVGQQDYAAREPIVLPGAAQATFTPLSGWAFRAKLLPGFGLGGRETETAQHLEIPRQRAPSASTPNP